MNTKSLVIRLTKELYAFFAISLTQQFKLIKNSKREGVVIGSAYNEFRI